MNFDMTYAQALKIQQEQIDFYGKHVPGGAAALRKRMKSMTRPVPPEGKDYYFSIFRINQMVPRGAAIEQVVSEMTNGSVRFDDGR